MSDAFHFTLRPFTIEDRPETCALWAAADGVCIVESDTEEALKVFLRRNPDFSLVAVHKDKIIGAVLCGHDGRRGCLYHLAVEKKYWRRGVGRALVERCLSRLRDAGILKCNIFVYADNFEGQKFWAANGWKARSELVLMQRPTG